jgi:hypothetical protein
VTDIEDSVKEQIQASIKMLNVILEEKVNDYELSDWIPNCVQCLQFALDNEDILIEKPSLYQDTVSTLYLLSEWIVNNEWYAYIELREKFKTVFSGEQVGTSLKCILNRMQELKTLSEEQKTIIPFTNPDGEFKSVEQILTELGDMWNDEDKN